MSSDHLEQLGLNIAWLADSITNEHLRAAAFAEGRFLFDPAWTAWSRAHYPFPDAVNTLIVDDVANERWRTSRKSGDVTCTVPVERLHAADDEGRLEPDLVDIFAAVFARWAEANDVPAPPSANAHTRLPDAYVDSVLSTPGPVLASDDDLASAIEQVRAVDDDGP